MGNTKQKLILSKGKQRKQKSLFYNTNFCWTNDFYVLLTVVLSKKKLFGLIKYANGSLTYIHLSHGFFIGSLNFASNLPPFLWLSDQPGITVLIYFLKKFSIFNNFIVNKKSKLAKSSGTFCQILEIYDNCTIKIKLPSGDQKVISSIQFATLGRCSNLEANRQVFGKAGSLRTFGRRAKVRGVAMNPVDHPHGGRTKTNKPEVYPWGWVTKKNK